LIPNSLQFNSNFNFEVVYYFRVFMLLRLQISWRYDRRDVYMTSQMFLKVSDSLRRSLRTVFSGSMLLWW